VSQRAEQLTVGVVSVPSGSLTCRWKDQVCVRETEKEREEEREREREREI
jgi:hypothetical protein